MEFVPKGAITLRQAVVRAGPVVVKGWVGDELSPEVSDYSFAGYQSACAGLLLEKALRRLREKYGDQWGPAVREWKGVAEGGSPILHEIAIEAGEEEAAWRLIERAREEEERTQDTVRREMDDDQYGHQSASRMPLENSDACEPPSLPLVYGEPISINAKNVRGLFENIRRELLPEFRWRSRAKQRLQAFFNWFRREAFAEEFKCFTLSEAGVKEALPAALWLQDDAVRILIDGANDGFTVFVEEAEFLKTCDPGASHRSNIVSRKAEPSSNGLIDLRDALFWLITGSDPSFDDEELALLEPPSDADEAGRSIFDLRCCAQRRATQATSNVQTLSSVFTFADYRSVFEKAGMTIEDWPFEAEDFGRLEPQEREMLANLLKRREPAARTRRVRREAENALWSKHLSGEATLFGAPVLELKGSSLVPTTGGFEKIPALYFEHAVELSFSPFCLLGPAKGTGTRQCRYAYVRLSFADLLTAFSSAELSRIRSGAPSWKLKSEGGKKRRTKYDWDAFEEECGRLFDHHGDYGPDNAGWEIPARAVDKMREWCLANWGENSVPHESQLKVHVTNARDRFLSQRLSIGGQ